MPTNVGKFIEDLDGGVFEEYQKEHLQGQSGEFIRLVRMGWNARGSYGDTEPQTVTGHENRQQPYAWGAVSSDGVVRYLSFDRDDAELLANRPEHEVVALYAHPVNSQGSLDGSDHVLGATKMVIGDV